MKYFATNTKFLLILFILLTATVMRVAAQETSTLNLNSYYPAPWGIYQKILISPRDDIDIANDTCRVGSFFVDDNNPVFDPYFCFSTGAGIDNGQWGPVSGIWEQGPDIVTGEPNVFLKDWDEPTIRVGIGTNTPPAKLTVRGSPVLFTGSTGGVPTTGAGTRFMWVPVSAALRAGTVDGAQWDTAATCSLGLGKNTTPSAQYSIATGNNTTASGEGAVAMGNSTTANGKGATAMGSGTTASGQGATAMGFNTSASGQGATTLGSGTTASGQGATAMGFNTDASEAGATTLGSGTIAAGQGATAMGNGTNASNTGATAMGSGTTASGQGALAMGNNTTAIGNHSTTMGSKVSTTANAQYSFAIGLNPSVANTYDLDQANTMVIMGGQVGIGTKYAGDPEDHILADITASLQIGGTLRLEPRTVMLPDDVCDAFKQGTLFTFNSTLCVCINGSWINATPGTGGVCPL